MQIKSTCEAITATAILAGIVMAGCAPPATQAPHKDEAPAAAAHQEAPHWDYGQTAGPASWGKLSPEYALCGEGRSQSPIDLAAGASGTTDALKLSYSPASLHIVHHAHKADVMNTGHSIQVNYPEADTLTVGGETFALAQYHFHSPSEHTIDGKQLPMEMHLGHKSSAGRLAVVGVLIEEGARNAAFDPIWANLPKAQGVSQHHEAVTVDVDQMLPKSHAAWRYDGSLTTPPCSEGVKWFVMRETIQMSADQIAAFRGILKGNNRPIQPLNGRTIMVSIQED